MRGKNFKEYLCPQVNFSLQLKQSHFSWWFAISFGDSHFKGRGGGFAGGNDKGVVDGGREVDPVVVVAQE